MRLSGVIYRVNCGVRRSKWRIECSGRAPSCPHLPVPSIFACCSDTSMPGTRRGSRNSQGRRMQIQFQTTNTTSHCRGAMRPSFALVFTLENKRAQGRPGCALHPRSRVQRASNKSAHEHTGSAESSPAFPAQWFYGLLRDLPGETSSIATVAWPNCSAKLGASVGRPNHATSPYAGVALVSRNLGVHRIPPRVRDDFAIRPSHRVRRADL